MTIEPNRLRVPWPEWFPPVFVHSPYGHENHNRAKYHKDADKDAAKLGDSDAAFRAIDKFISYNSLASVSRCLCGRTTYVVAPVKPNQPRGNVLAHSFASDIANELDLMVAEGIFQYPRSKRDRRTEFFFRFANAPEFFGDVHHGADYIIADDVLTYGATAASLRGYLESNGARVICVTTLAGNPAGEVPLAISQESLNFLKGYRKGALDGFFEEVLGYGIECFTEREACELRKRLERWAGRFSLDGLRKGIVRERGDADAA